MNVFGAALACLIAGPQIGVGLVLASIGIDVLFLNSRTRGHKRTSEAGFRRDLQIEQVEEFAAPLKYEILRTVVNPVVDAVNLVVERFCQDACLQLLEHHFCVVKTQKALFIVQRTHDGCLHFVSLPTMEAIKDEGVRCGGSSAGRESVRLVRSVDLSGSNVSLGNALGWFEKQEAMYSVTEANCQHFAADFVLFLRSKKT
mmetsp:Transcript_4645/g.7200  ORF Transcript_4645/g.7200 Transcript_4645/m.7200 type:complete len:201 (-) Transcript_4645:470-1072(-)